MTTTPSLRSLLQRAAIQARADAPKTTDPCGPEMNSEEIASWAWPEAAETKATGLDTTPTDRQLIPAPEPAAKGDALIDDLEEQLRLHSANRLPARRTEPVPAPATAVSAPAGRAERYTHSAARGVSWIPPKSLAPARRDFGLWKTEATASPPREELEEPARRRSFGWTGLGMFVRTAAVVVIGSGVAYAALLVLPHSSQPVADGAAVAEMGAPPTTANALATSAAAAPAYGEMWLRDGAAAPSTTAVDPPTVQTAAIEPPTTVVSTTVVPGATAPASAALQTDAEAAVPAGSMVAPATGTPAPVSAPAADPGLAPDDVLTAEKPIEGDGPGVAPLNQTTPAAEPEQVAAVDPTPDPVEAAPAPRVTAPPAPPVAAAAPAPAAPAPPAAQGDGGKRLIATANEFVNMRSGPRSGASVITVVAEGAQVEVIRCNFWCEVSVDGRQGYIYQDYLDGPITRRSR